MRGAAVLAVLAVTGTAVAQTPEPQRFGARGQLVLNGDLAISGGHRWAETGSFTNDSTFISVSPSLDYFVLPGVSLGATLGMGVSFSEVQDVTQLGAGLRVGYALPLAERVSLWPRLGASLFTLKFESSFNGSEHVSRSTFGRFELFTPVLVHPTSSFFLGVGPALGLDVGDARGVALGAQSLIGGNF